MQTRREQVRAYRFVTRRIVSALLSGEPETTELPMRRLGLALFGSVLVAAIVLAGVGAYGLLNPGGGRPADNSVVIERETGARYVYTQATLFPVYNFTSALLILGSPDATVQTLSRNSLRGVPRSRRTYGILAAPDSLPDPKALVQLPWTVCSMPRSTDTTAPATRLLIGDRPAGGAELDDAALLVVIDGTNSRYLLWHNRALKIAGSVTLAALGMAAATPLTVGSGLINGTVAGPELRIPEIDGDGAPSGRAVGGRPASIGSVYKDEHGQHYVMLAGGLTTIGEPMADLILATGKPDEPIGAGEAGSLLTVKKIEPDGFPSYLPKLIQPSSGRAAVCTAYSRVADTGTDSSVLIYDRPPAQLVPAAGESAVPQTNRSIRTADFVTVVGQGALVRPVSAPGASGDGNTAFLITAQGVRYPLESRSGDAQAALGYGAVAPLDVPLAMLELIPLGPTLDIATARKPPSPSSTGGPGAPVGTSSPSPSPSPSPSRRGRRPARRRVSGRR